MVLDNIASDPDPVTGAIALPTAAAKELLQDVIRRCQHKLVVFDLDSTLLNNRPRSARIMREFAQTHDFPLLAKAEPVHFPTWSTRDSMALLGLDENQIDEIIDDYLDFWAVRFFTSDYCKLDSPINGAVSFVNAVHTAGGIVTYLTGRDETMREGTVQSLQQHGFIAPGIEQVSLIMKPDADAPDDDYKHTALQEIKQQFEVAAAFDNEPTHINSYRKIFSDSICVHLDTDHSMRQVRLLSGVISVRDFEH